MDKINAHIHIQAYAKITFRTVAEKSSGALIMSYFFNNFVFFPYRLKISAVLFA